MSKDIPAFPSHGSMGEVCQEGMTIRDYFAIRIVQSRISLGAWTSNTDYIKESYELADLMLKEKEKEKHD